MNQVGTRKIPGCARSDRFVVKKVEESTKPSTIVAFSVGPPAPTEEQVKKRDIEDVKVEDTKKNDAEDAMDVEQTLTQPPLKETVKHPSERPYHHSTPTTTDRKEAEDAPHAR